MMTRGGSCHRHRSAAAGWRCAGCRADLCGACAAVRKMGTAAMVVCVSCGDRAERITRPRRELPFLSWLSGLHRFPLGRAVLPSLAALALFRAVVSSLPFGFVGAALVQGSFWAYLFYIIRTSASGKTWLGVPDFRDFQEDIVAPSIKGAVATALIWGPAAAYGILVRGWALDELLSARALGDPVLWLLVLLGTLYVPMALTAAATDVGLLGLLNPVAIVRAIRRVGRDYVTATGVLALLGVLDLLVNGIVVRGLARLPIPLLGRVLAEAVALYVPFMMARVLGMLLHVHGDALDWGEAHHYADPVVAGDPWGTPPGPKARPAAGQGPPAGRP